MRTQDKQEKGAHFLQTLKAIREEKETGMVEETKICSACGESLPATEDYFYKDKRARTGLSSWCRGCTRAKQKAKDLKKSKADRVEVIALDFAGRAEMYDRLAEDARDEFRTLDQQVLWIIHDYFNRVPV